MVRTGAYAYVKYGYETGDSPVVFGGTATVNKSFGLKTAVSGLSLNTGRQQLYKLGQVEPENFFYGQQKGSLSLDFVLGDVTSGDVFQAIYGAPSGAGTGASNHVYGSDTGYGSSKTFVGQSFTTELGFEGETDYLIRTFKGCIINTFDLTATIGDAVKCTADVQFGKEDTPSNASGDYTPLAASVETSQPFTFAHGQFSLNGVIQTQIQDVNINFAQNGDLLYEIGSNQAVAGIKKTLDITGRFKVALKDKTAINALIAQLAGANYKETWGDKYAGSPEFELHFTNGVVGNGERKITIIGKGLGIADHSVSGLEPVEPVFEEINWQIKSAKIVVVNSQ
jgi:hypothetical protein